MKPLIAYAVVKKKNPKIKFIDIFENKDVVYEKDEKLIKIKIQEC